MSTTSFPSSVEVTLTHAVEVFHDAASTHEARSNAERILLEFQESTSPYKHCSELLDSSTASPLVQFQAAATVKTAAIREWTLLAAEEQTMLRDYLLTRVTQPPILPRVVQLQLLQAVAVMLKRGWDCNDNSTSSMKETLMSQLDALYVARLYDVAAGLMMAVIAEFESSSRSGCIGLSWDFHAACKRSFETESLHKLFTMAIRGLCEHQAYSFITVCEAILSWPFPERAPKCMTGTFNETVNESAGGSIIAPTLVCPGEAWHDILVSPKTLDIFFDAVNIDENYRHNVGECLLLLASLSGRVFKDGESAGYLSYFLNCFTPLLKRGSEDVYDERRLASITNRFTIAFPSHVIDSVALSSFSEAALAATFRCMRTIEPDDETLDEFLDFWTSMRRAPSFEIFRSYVDMRLTIAKRDEDDFIVDEDSDLARYGDQLCQVATLARADLGNTLPLLLTLIQDMHAANELEAMYWLILISGYVFADSGDGEVPMVPSAVDDFVTKQNGGDHVMALTEKILALPPSSARLAEGLAWFYRRWSETYLSPDPSVYGGHIPPIVLAFNSSHMQFVIGRAIALCTQFSADQDAGLTSAQLILSLSRRPQPFRGLLFASDEWGRFVHELTVDTVSSPLYSAPPLVMSTVVHAICSSDIENGVDKLWRVMTECLSDNSETRLPVTMEMINGMMLATCSNNARSLFMRLKPILKALAVSITTVSGNAASVCGLLTVFETSAEVLHPHLDPSTSTCFCQYVLELLRTYSLWFVDVLLDEDDQRADQLIQLLKMLTHIISRDFLGFEDTGSGLIAEVHVINSTEDGNVAVADVVLYGLHTLLPLLKDRLLNYPVLATCYFKLISFVADIFPEKLCSGDAVEDIVLSLTAGLGSAGASEALDAMAALATYAYKTNVALPPILLEEVLMLVLMRNFNSELFEAAAGALFALICSQQQHYTTLVNQILASHTDVRLPCAFSQLLTSNDLQPKLDRCNTGRFRKNLDTFLGVARGVLRMK